MRHEARGTTAERVQLALDLWLLYDAVNRPRTLWQCVRAARAWMPAVRRELQSRGLERGHRWEAAEVARLQAGGETLSFLQGRQNGRLHSLDNP